MKNVNKIHLSRSHPSKMSLVTLAENVITVTLTECVIQCIYIQNLVRSTAVSPYESTRLLQLLLKSWNFQLRKQTMSVAGKNWQTTRPTIRERSKFMFNNDLFSDVKFVIEKPDDKCESKQVIPAHKFVLSISSPVFEAMNCLTVSTTVCWSCFVTCTAMKDRKSVV